MSGSSTFVFVWLVQNFLSRPLMQKMFYGPSLYATLLYVVLVQCKNALYFQPGLIPAAIGKVIRQTVSISLRIIVSKKSIENNKVVNLWHRVGQAVMLSQKIFKLWTRPIDRQRRRANI